ncbi:Speckle-type POZ protein [Araneus ventricosus]|uniref:Speckle-type POZ protein n=1 Tax=Araneus ventricosus TaxID=182803 RepID=A0A4Y2LFM1_ARAVE|nr:Speckle-type POZ protein [Araneus ventricosus]
MEYERKGVSITWQVDNARYIRKRKMELYSPVISVDVMDGTNWKLGVHRMSEFTMWLTIEREAEDKGPGEFGLTNYEFSVNELRGTSSIRKTMYTYTFQKGQRCPEVAVNYRKIGKSFTSDTITIRCKIWKQRGSISKNGHFFLRTRMRTERCKFVGVIKNFSGFYMHDMKTWKLVSSSTNERLVKVNLHLFRLIKIEIIPMDNQDERFLNFKLFILDSSGNKANIGQLEQEFILKSHVEFHLPDVSKNYLMENSAQYLPNDTLSLHCEITFCSGKEYDNVERSEYETESIADVQKTEFSNVVELLTSKEGIPCDTKIQTATETFPAHTDILSAQSPIFEAMFKTKMEETIQKCVRIDDVDAETVKRMLVFLYSDAFEEMGWKDAMKLYFAADKYQILSLKSRCTTFLKQSVCLSNCVVLLLLADMHQDNDLMRAVHSYITEYGQEVLHGDQWRDLEKNLPQLAIETLRDVFLETMLI